MNFRLALHSDIPKVTELLTHTHSPSSQDKNMLDARRLAESLQAKRILLWLGLEGSDERLRAFLLLLYEKDHGLCKIHRIFMDRSFSEQQSKAILSEAIYSLKQKITESIPDLDVIYGTTLTLSLEEQAETLRQGFELLGIFPRFHSQSLPKTQGISAYFLKDSLRERRYSRFSLHPTIEPFYKQIQRRLQLPSLPAARPSDTELPSFQSDPLPHLELIQASKWVARKFELSKHHQALSNQFYPFRSPNALLTDPDQRVEVFLQIAPAYRFASLIGERIDLRVKPQELYRKAVSVLHSAGITYVEMVIDAADSLGIQCVLEAGFHPCAYFPSFKRLGHFRRDYAVLASSLEPPYVPTGEDRSRLDLRYFEFYSLGV